MSGALPSGACDTHCHVFGPQAHFPYAPGRTTPFEAPKEALFAMHRRYGFDRAVIVHPNLHGFDNSVTLDAIAASGGAYRGVALVPDDVTSDGLRALDAGGIRGVRFNFPKHLGPPPSESTVRRIGELIAPLGWHVLLHVMPEHLETAWAYVKPLNVPVVIDHMARVSTADGVDDRAFRRLLEMASDPRCWVKISGGDRASATGAPFDDAVPFARAILETAPQRTLWGTDWPHPNVKGPTPQEDDLVSLLHKIVPEEDLLRQVLVDNPDRLYRFDERSAG